MAASLVSRSKLGLTTRTGIALYTRTPNQVSEFIVHYDGGKTPITEAEELQLLQAYDRYHAGKGWGGIGYSLAVGPVTGKVYEARGLGRVGAHTTGHNTSGVGVIVIGGKGNLTAAAKQGLKDALEISEGWAGKPLTPSGHLDHADTSCPGEEVYAWIQAGGLTQKKEEPVSTKKQTTKIDGCVVPIGTAAAFKKLAAAFEKATGYSLHVRDGLRTYAEQKDLYDRWKAGTFYAPSVAYPGTSLHETGKALDIYDSGSTPGVTVAGNIRSNWIRKNAKTYGFDPAGYGFNEPWHIEYQGDPWKAPGTGSTSTSSGAKPYTGKLTIGGNARVYTIRRLQTVLGTSPTGKIGPQYAGNKKYLPAFHTITYTATGGTGSSVVKALQKQLGVTADGQLGPATIKAWQKKLGVIADGYAGKNTVKAIQKSLNNGKVW